MPRTRTGQARADKRDEILDEAERQLQAAGYAEFSVAAVARKLGVAQNTIYWYFPTKDHLFVATLRRLFGRTIERKRAQELDLADEIVWFVDQLHELAPLRAALNARAPHSDAAAELAADLRTTLQTMLANALRPHVPDADLPATAEAFSATVEGAILQAPDDPVRRRRIVAFALDRLTAGRLRPTPS